MECKYFCQIEIGRNYGKNEWNEDMKKILRYAGCDGSPITFFLSDNQIADSSFLEDINMLLNTGDIPNLYQSDDRVDILDKVSNISQTLVSYCYCCLFHRKDNGPH